MNYKIRQVRTKSKSVAIQVFQIVNRKSKVLKHIGSGKTEDEIQNLKEQAQNWINLNTEDVKLFKFSEDKDPYFSNYKFLGSKCNYAYEFLNKVICKFQFEKHLNKLIKDLLVIQILEPSSKRQNILNLEKYFGIKYDLSKLYRLLSKFDNDLKILIEKEVITFAKKEYAFDFNFVLYDVTTLYFESFKNDEFKRPGFSKDHKHNQPQIVLGLITTKEGFPIHYEVFDGNTFEGNTFLPIILDFKKQHSIKTLTVVADAAMLSKINLDKLKENQINYIIGARLANQKQIILDHIQKKIQRIDKFSIRVNELIVEYKEDRYKKDKLEMEKQIDRAKRNLSSTTKIQNLKFVKNDKVKRYLDEDLVDKQIKLLGLKGYISNLNLENAEIINYYHNLFKIEHAFRIAKSDLEIRPIFHFKKNTILNHIFISFMCLVISTYLELKNHKSIKQITTLLKEITDAEILNLKTNKVIIDRKKVQVELLH